MPGKMLPHTSLFTAHLLLGSLSNVWRAADRRLPPLLRNTQMRDGCRGSGKMANQKIFPRGCGWAKPARELFSPSRAPK
ncbi:hypothetical protein QBC35DRAFT_510252 [Podospora australis]|uniref:Secreted protein n=1 Tax=Podospora australis TaxID=1536484 RepID=A0AAN7AB97_9PEZI|nr:hypothetical protein QBC35DRAFT_510252 [Podospora australis]